MGEVITSGEPTTRRRPMSGPWRAAIRHGVFVWAIAEVMYLLVNTLYWMTRRDAGPVPSEFFSVWNRWDTGHYLYIAEHGYNASSENPAFFPLYPLIMHLVEPVLPGGMLSAGLIVSSVACLVSIIVLYRLADDLFDTQTAQRAALYLMVFPFAFFLVAAYNESLFVALTAISLYAMHRGRWWVAGVAAGFATAARMAGLLLALAFLIEYLRQRQWRPARIRSDVLALLLVPTGLFAFMIYDAVILDDPLRFMHAQAIWGRRLTTPWHGVTATIQQISPALAERRPFHPLVVLDVIDLISVPLVIALLALSIWGPWRLGRQAWYLIAYGIASFLLVILIPMAPPLLPLHGLPRFSLENLALFLVLAKMGSSRAFDRVYVVLAVALQATLLIAFFGEQWLA